MNLFTSFLLAICALFPGVDIHENSPATGAFQTFELLLIEPLDLQQSGPVYDAAFYGDDIMFLKSGEEGIFLTSMLRPDPASSRPLFNDEEISCSPAAITFSEDFSVAFYTSPVVGSDQAWQEKIFEMSLEEGMGSKPILLSFTSDPSRNLHPAISTDGKLMVFSSDRHPGMGGLDLFVTRKTEDGWSIPLNPGELINTSGHEWYPFLDQMNNLWFSSSGHSGYGGFDIYICPYKDGEWGAPKNLGEAINGPHNELGFSIHSGKQAALFSRSRPSESKGSAIMITLNEDALNAAGMDDASAREISLVLLGIADPEVQKNVAPEQDTIHSTDPVEFRVQIISSLYENSFPTVLIGGRSYNTYEYHYLGSYRITVGKFNTLKEASEFRKQCLESGFQQAFVAAFRGDKRETDPSVFK